MNFQTPSIPGMAGSSLKDALAQSHNSTAPDAPKVWQTPDFFELTALAPGSNTCSQSTDAQFLYDVSTDLTKAVYKELAHCTGLTDFNKILLSYCIVSTLNAKKIIFTNSFAKYERKYTNIFSIIFGESGSGKSNNRAAISRIFNSFHGIRDTHEIQMSLGNGPRQFLANLCEALTEKKNNSIKQQREAYFCTTSKTSVKPIIVIEDECIDSFSNATFYQGKYILDMSAGGAQGEEFCEPYSGTLFVTRWHAVNMFLFTQEGTLNEMFTQKKINRGYAARFVPISIGARSAEKIKEKNVLPISSYRLKDYTDRHYMISGAVSQSVKSPTSGVKMPFEMAQKLYIPQIIDSGIENNELYMRLVYILCEAQATMLSRGEDATLAYVDNRAQNVFRTMAATGCIRVRDFQAKAQCRTADEARERIEELLHSSRKIYTTKRYGKNISAYEINNVF